MRITLLRHATLLLELRDRRLLVDPMLSAPGTLPPTEGTPNQLPNPLVPLPSIPLDRLDAVLVTHLHRDHFDDAAAQYLPKQVPLFCQPEDAETLRAQHFVDVRPVEDALHWEGLAIHRTGGRHGTGELGARMGPVSGFVLDSLYVAGDTIWCDEVEDALERHRPGVAVVNAGAAQFLEGDPITMTAEDVSRVAERTKTVAVHMEAWNHCLLRRAELRAAVPGIWIPADGETLNLFYY